MQNVRPRGMQHDAYRNYKRAKRAFRNARDKEYEIFIQSVNCEIDEATELDLRLFRDLLSKTSNIFSILSRNL